MKAMTLDSVLSSPSRYKWEYPTIDLGWRNGGEEEQPLEQFMDPQLKAELDAWEAASDEALENLDDLLG